MKPMVARLRALALAALLPLMIGACGFQPLYAQPGVTGGMSAISIVTPQTRTGYLMREQLEDELAVNKGATPRYKLAVAIVERRRPRGLNPDDTPTRYELRLDVTYVLTELPGGKVLLTRTRPVFISADAVVQPYASIAAQEDSEQRAASEAAQAIRTDVALTLSGK
jgi:LPS-assembly lipoprotein